MLCMVMLITSSGWFVLLNLCAFCDAQPFFLFSVMSVERKINWIQNIHIYIYGETRQTRQTRQTWETGKTDDETDRIKLSWQIKLFFCVSKHSSYFSFFLHKQNFWRIKFTPKKRVNYGKTHSKLPIFCVITAKYTVNCQRSWCLSLSWSK